MVNCMMNIEFQLSQLFAYLNTGISGAGQRDSYTGNRGWAVQSSSRENVCNMARL